MMTTKRRSRGGSGRLTEIYRFLDDQGQRTLLDFAEFLAARVERGKSEQLLEPRPEQRPARESVVAAIKRLSRTYFMLDRSSMLNETSSLMGAHVLHGRPAAEVIDDLEALFEREYAKYRNERQT